MNETKQILKAIGERQLRSNFWTTINKILRDDCTQSCTTSEGTRIRLTRDSIIIEDEISSATLKELMATGYLICGTEEGRICIQQIRLGESK